MTRFYTFIPRCSAEAIPTKSELEALYSREVERMGKLRRVSGSANGRFARIDRIPFIQFAYLNLDHQLNTLHHLLPPPPRSSTFP